MSHADAWENLISGLGVSGYDRRLETNFVADIIPPEIAQQLWRGNDIAGRVISEPAHEAMREGFEVDVADDSDASDDIGARLEETGAFAKCAQAIEFARAYGGGAIFPVVNDGASDLRQPLNVDRIRKIENLVVLEPREIVPLTYYEDVRNPKYRLPEIWQLQPIGTSAQGLGVTAIHESRIVYFPGIVVSNDPCAQSTPGHGDSVLTRMWAVLRDFGGAWDSTGLLVQDWQTTLWKIRNLTEMVAMDKSGAFKARMNAAQLSKSLLRAIMIDSEGESFERNSVNVTGLPDLLDRYGARLSAAAGGFPLTRLLGISPAGLNATGESDTRGWYDFCGRVRAYYTKPIEELAWFYVREIDGPTGGKEPELWSVCWPPLWQESAKEQADTAKVIADTDTAYVNAAVFSPEEIRKARSGAEDGYISIDDATEDPIATPEEAATLRDPNAPADQPAAAVEPAKTAFTGVQVTALVDVVKAANAKEISRESAAAIIELAFPVSAAQAVKILGPEDFEPTKPPAPAPFGAKPPPDDKNPDQPPGDGGKDSDQPPTQDRADVIEKRGAKWVVLSMEGEVLGTHETEEEAKAQLRAVEASKHAGK